MHSLGLHRLVINVKKVVYINDKHTNFNIIFASGSGEKTMISRIHRDL